MHQLAVHALTLFDAARGTLLALPGLLEAGQGFVGQHCPLDDRQGLLAVGGSLSYVPS